MSYIEIIMFGKINNSYMHTQRFLYILSKQYSKQYFSRDPVHVYCNKRCSEKRKLQTFRILIFVYLFFLLNDNHGELARLRKSKALIITAAACGKGVYATSLCDVCGKIIPWQMNKHTAPVLLPLSCYTVNAKIPSFLGYILVSRFLTLTRRINTYITLHANCSAGSSKPPWNYKNSININSAVSLHPIMAKSKVPV